MKVNRVILVVMDSIGVGGLPDAESFGDFGVNTLGTIARSTDNFKIPNLMQLGIGNIEGIDFIDAVDSPTGAFGKCAEKSNGKDTTTGHWEMAGLLTEIPFQTYPDGFPKHIIDEFIKQTGRGVLCNKPSSGTVVLDELGEEHMKTGDVIVYTSADSVFQIAAHEEIVPLEELYDMCEKARKILMGDDQVARVIARPFLGEPGNFKRTTNRHDYSVSPTGKTVLDFAKEKGLDVLGVGKISDIFNGQGITGTKPTKSNMDGVDKTIEFMKTDSKGIIFTNLVDFDALFGHRRNIEGYKESIEEFDARIPEMIAAMNDDDIIMFTADHGNDPGYKGSDHTREYVPLLVYGKNVKAGVDLGIRETFADISTTISDILEIGKTDLGESFKGEILK